MRRSGSIGFRPSRGGFPALAATLAALAAAPFVAAITPARAEPALRLERAVLLMRHGVRPPTKDPAMPAGIAADPWPTWSVAPGYLTQHGADAVKALGAADRARFASLLGVRGCPATGAVRARSDSDQRTIATGTAWLMGIAPDCRVPNDHLPQDEPDRLFMNAGENGEPYDPARADGAVAAMLGTGGIAGAERAERATLARLDQVLCGSASTACGVASQPSGISPGKPDARPKLTGALDRGSTAAQILLLEYADGKPMDQVGWGRAGAADIALFSRLHAAEFAILARPLYLATTNAAPIARDILTRLKGPARVVALVGHDTNVASLGGMLGLHWQVPGYADDDPPPGGAILFEQLRDARGRRFIRTSFRAQDLEGLRRGDGVPAYQTMAVQGCTALCPLESFIRIVTHKLANK